MAKVKFPKKIYIYDCDPQADEPCLATATTVSEIDDGPAALYELVHTGNKVTHHNFLEESK